MKAVPILFIALFLFTNTISAQEKVKEVTFFGDNPGNLKMWVANETSSSDSTLRPLVVALHGCSQSVEGLSYQSGWTDLAEKNDFVMLYPNQKRVNNVSKCFNWFEESDINRGYGEMKSIINMIDYAIENFSIDTNRIYIYGVSAGAAMSVALMAEYPAYFSAGASFAGAPYKIANGKVDGLKVMLKPKDLTPKQWGSLVKDNDSIAFPKLIVGHGVNDFVVDIKNSEELIEQWTDVHHVDTVPDRVASKFHSYNVDRITYENADNEECVVFYKFYNIGHAIPVNPGDGDNMGGKTSVYSKDIGFFSTYYVAKDFGLIHSVK